MNLLLSAIFAFSFFALQGPTAQAADVVCNCEEGLVGCSNINFTFVETDGPGTYMTVSYAFGQREFEGYAMVRRHLDGSKTVYSLGQYVLVNEGGSFHLPARGRTCSAAGE